MLWGLGLGAKLGNYSGTLGVETSSFGPLLDDVDLDPDDVSDLIETMAGVAGYFADGDWTLRYKLSSLKLGDDPRGTLSSGDPYASAWTYKFTVVDVVFGYTAYRSANKKVALTPIIGIRYIKHKPELTLSVGGAIGESRFMEFDQNWTDFLIGATASIALAPKWIWSLRGDAGFGGSEGTYNFQTAVSWRFWDKMSAGPTFSYMAVDYENGDIGDADWFLYDMDESGVGFGFMFHF
jgi:hypothetical protein